jgi:hypothetical protein
MLFCGGFSLCFPCISNDTHIIGSTSIIVFSFEIYFFRLAFVGLMFQPCKCLYIWVIEAKPCNQQLECIVYVSCGGVFIGMSSQNKTLFMCDVGQCLLH